MNESPNKPVSLRSENPPRPLTYSVVLTPPGAGAIAVIRVIGKEAVEVAGQVFRSRRGGALSTDRPNRLRYGLIVDGDDTIDDVLACVIDDLPVPVVEFCAHGGVRVVERILCLLDKYGAPLISDTGGDSDVWCPASLIEREADDAFVKAKTDRAVRFLARQRSALPQAIEALSTERDPQHVRSVLRSYVEGFDAARLLIDGATVAIVGPPNSGKSTLFNRLAGRDAAVVSPTPGTTRDWITETIDLEGVPVTLLDTAGGHSTTDDLERAAVDAGRGVSASADLLLLVFDGSAPLPGAPHEPVSFVHADRPWVLVVNKCDRPRVWNANEFGAGFAPPCELGIEVSAQTGAGVDRLLRAMLDSLGIARWTEDALCVFTGRQRLCISRLLSLPITDVDGVHRGLLDLLQGSG